jgi:DNA-directed RNA polymerase specialized sigma24 family protein
MTFKEIANQLNMSESAVKMRYYRGLEKVTKNIKKQL